jgi:putative MATE family efflux protein
MIDMTKGNIPLKIIRFTIPLLVGNIFQQLYNVADTVIVGQFVGKEGMAAVGVAFPIMFLLIALVMGATMGTTVLISQFFGAKDIKNLKRTISTAYILLFGSSIIVMFLGIISRSLLLDLLKTPVEIRKDASIYLLVIFTGTPFMFGYNGLSAILRGVGDSKTPLYLLIVSTVLNILLDLLFVILFGWGVTGAAIATVISQGVSFFLGIYFLHKKNSIFNIEGKLVFDRQIFMQSIKIGMPSGIQQIMISIGSMALMNIINRFGTDTLAAFTAATRIEAFAIMPAMNFGIAITTFVGQNLGARQLERVKSGVKSTIFMTLSLSIVTSILLMVFAKFLVSIFTTDPLVIRLGREYFMIVAPFYFTFALMFVFGGVLRGAGDTVVPMFSSIISQFLLRVPASAILSNLWGTRGIWWGIPIAWWFGMLFSFTYYKIGKWKEKRAIDFKKEEIIEELEKF